MYHPQIGRSARAAGSQASKKVSRKLFIQCSFFQSASETFVIAITIDRMRATGGIRGRGSQAG
jgi:hypothetical protein